MKEYNGHRSWNTWNVALWINNDEGLYNLALEDIELTKSKKTGKYRFGAAASRFVNNVGGGKTPDGATFNRLSVKLALENLKD